MSNLNCKQNQPECGKNHQGCNLVNKRRKDENHQVGYNGCSNTTTIRSGCFVQTCRYDQKIVVQTFQRG